MSHDFDRILDRRGSSSTKWRKFPADVLPMWVADMDFPAPGFVLDAIRARLDHPILGYTDKPEALLDAFESWLFDLYGWRVPQDSGVWLPGVVPGLNAAAQTLDGGSLLLPTPVYHPFLDVAANAGLEEIRVPMTPDADRVWRFDFDRMDDAVRADTRMLLFCNPQNPTGRCYEAEELRALAAFVERHDLLLVSDEIHCNIVLRQGARHQPIAHLVPEIARRTISLYAATKAYNIPGLSCAVAVIPDADLRARFLDARKGLVPGIGPLGFAASEAAFLDHTSYLDELRGYLAGNLGLLEQTLGPRLARLDGTYLAWIDVGDLGFEDTETHFAAHGLGINPGAMFGEPSFVRLNFGCARATLAEGLARLQRGIEAAS